MNNLLNKVIVIDDDLSMNHLLLKIIKSEGYQCHTFVDPDEGLKAVESELPHLVFIDINFSKSNLTGYDLLKSRMKNKTLMKIPFVVISNETHKKTIQKSMAYKANDFVTKPISSYAIRHKLEKFLSRANPLSLDVSDQQILAHGKITAQMLRISEVAVEINSPVRFEDEKPVQMNNELIDKLEMNGCKFSPVEQSIPSGLGLHKTLLKIQGLTHKLTKNIRVFLNED